MDSVTHVIVGAAIGQLIAGKKYGMKPMIWGAIGGSLPDIDVVSGLWLNPVDAVLAHRGITHSILFILLISPLLGYLVVKFHDNHVLFKKGFRFFIASSLLVLGLIIGVVVNLLAYGFSALLLIPTLLITVWGGLIILRIFRAYVVENPKPLKVHFKDAWLIYLITLISHLFLDCCTAYGTGLFEPFSNARISFNNISVADIFFTIPAILLFTLGIIQKRRFMYLRLTLVWCSMYLVLTAFNASHMDKVFTDSLAANQIKVSNKIVSPSILNNFLWYSMAEGDTAFYFGQYSLFEKNDVVKEFITLPKSWNKLSEGDYGDKSIVKLKRFSQGYYNLCNDDKGKLQWNDLRFGFMGQKVFTAGDYVFKFSIEKNNSGWEVHQDRGPQKPINEIWAPYWKRVWSN